LKFNFKELNLNSFQKNIATLFSGTLIAQVISTIGAIFLAKLYAPELYGTYSVFLSFVSILIVINTLKFEYAIVISNKDKDSKNILNGLILFILGIGLIQLLIFTILKVRLSTSSIPTIVFILSIIGAIALSNVKVFESFATRKSFFKTIASARFITAICTVGFQYLFFYYSEFGLVFGYLTSVFIVLVFYLLKTNNLLHFPKFPSLKKQLKQHKNIFKFAFPSGLINTIALHIMPILIFTYFSSKSSGVYALSFKIVSVPLFLISSSVSQVYFQKASELYNTSRHKLYDLTKKLVKTNIITMIVVLILINTIGIYLLNLFFDTQWDGLNMFVLILSFFVLGQISFSPISSIIIITNKMHIGFIFNISLLIINVLAIIIGNYYNNIIYTILVLSIFGGSGYVLLLYYFLKHLKLLKHEA